MCAFFSPYFFQVFNGERHFLITINTVLSCNLYLFFSKVFEGSEKSQRYVKWILFIETMKYSHSKVSRCHRTQKEMVAETRGPLVMKETNRVVVT